MNPLSELRKLGQSVWYDNIRRGLITSRELQRMVDEYGLAGVTTNPTIFEKAVSETGEYDGEIARHAADGLGAAEILTKLVVKDIKLAADVLSRVYEESGSRDGFVSVEVDPGLARDAEATIKEARRLSSLIRKPNLMVKVPATVEGLLAIERLTYEGLNINVTLLFSVARYEEVAWAYIRGLEKRALEGKPLGGISSVASFFVSRVDTLADKLIEGLVEAASSNDQKARLKALAGRIAVANAKAAYSKYLEIRGGERFARLEDRGAAPQRLLWASTGAKNPLYPDVKYVEALIGKDTVSTMPLHAMLAFLDHGKAAPTLAQDLDGAGRLVSELSELGIDYAHIASRLEDEGIKAFADSHGMLLRCIEGKVAALPGGPTRAAEFSLDGYEAPVSEALEQMEDNRFLSRLWSKDPTLWKKAPSDRRLIKDALGWLTVPEVMDEHKDTMIEFADEVREAGFADVVLLGMGGSSLAPLVMSETFGPAAGYPRLHVLDSTDPGAVRSVEALIDPQKTLFIVSSKSGSTIELLSLFEYFYKNLHAVMSGEAGRNFVAITDPGTPLEGFSRKYRFRRLFLNPPDIGGRFSALSYFGLVPAALAGIDISRLLYHAARLVVATQPCVHTADNPGIRLGAALGTFASAGRDKLTFFFSDEIRSLGLWLEQLIAESTGKEGKGLVPIINEPAARPSDYGDDRAFVYIGLGPPDRKTGSFLSALSKAGHPVITLRLDDLYGLGGEFFRWEVATAAAGEVLGINPFDQPDVELSKKITISRLGDIGRKGPPEPPGVQMNGKGFRVSFGHKAYGEMEKAVGKGDASAAAMKSFMALVGKGDYLGLLAYFNPADREVEEDLAQLRRTLRDATGAATQLGWGPRYLHSTGQLHKGGSHNGVFIMLSHEADEDLAIPGSPFSFSELELSQAFGDMEALDSKGRRVVLFTLKDASSRSLREVGSFIRRSVGAAE